MSSRHSVLVAGAPSGIGADSADFFAGRGFHDAFVTDGRTLKNGALHGRFRLADQGRSPPDSVRLDEQWREHARIMPKLRDTLLQVDQYTDFGCSPERFAP